MPTFLAHCWIIFAHWCSNSSLADAPLLLTDPPYLRFRMFYFFAHFSLLHFRRINPTYLTSHSSSRAVDASLYFFPHLSLTQSPTANETAVDTMLYLLTPTQKPIAVPPSSYSNFPKEWGRQQTGSFRIFSSPTDTLSFTKLRSLMVELLAYWHLISSLPDARFLRSLMDFFLRSFIYRWSTFPLLMINFFTH